MVEIYNQNIIDKAEKKSFVEGKAVNSFVLNITNHKQLLPETGYLEETEFLYRNWKATHSNNSNAKIVGVSAETGMRRH